MQKIKFNEPNFICRALISKDKVRGAEVDKLVDKLFEGSAEMLFASLIGRSKLSDSTIEKLRGIVDEVGGEA